MNVPKTCYWCCHGDLREVHGSRQIPRSLLDQHVCVKCYCPDGRCYGRHVGPDTHSCPQFLPENRDAMLRSRGYEMWQGRVVPMELSIRERQDYLASTDRFEHRDYESLDNARRRIDFVYKKKKEAKKKK